MALAGLDWIIAMVVGYGPGIGDRSIENIAKKMN